jgi:hypothetical protein
MKKIQQYIRVIYTALISLVSGKFKRLEERFLNRLEKKNIEKQTINKEQTTNNNPNKNYYNMWTDKNVKSKIERYELNRFLFSNFKKMLQESEKWKDFSKIISYDDTIVEFKLFDDYYILRLNDILDNNKNEYVIEHIEYTLDNETLKYVRTNKFTERLRFILFGSNTKYIERNYHSNDSTTNSKKVSTEFINIETEFNNMLPLILI